MTDAGAVVPELAPARMVNEATYCQRLFYLEWVQSQFDDSADTVDGRYQHRTVDAGGGRVPEDAEELKVARSVLLSSPELGLIGRIDLLEAEDGSVVPVDYKRGSPPDRSVGAWEPERVQVAVLGLLLRAEGYRCERGALWFAESRQRIDVVLDDVTERALATVAEMRRLAALPTAPPPLVGSPKCQRCSLVGICLPDEHNALLSRSSAPPRRLVPHDANARSLYVTEPGSTVGVRGGRLEVWPPASAGQPRGRPASIRLIDVSHVAVYGNVQVSTQALVELFAREAPVLFHSHGGWLRGVASGLPSKHVELRRRQVALAASGGLAAARGFVEGKIRNSRTLLRRNTRAQPVSTIARLLELARQAAEAENPASLLGFEGFAARLYFQEFPTLLRDGAGLPGAAFEFTGRNRRSPRDAVNCLLSFVYPSW